jgi:acetyl esterase/lipase
VVFQPPNRNRATHTAVIICPGGGFLWLSIDTEGYDVARALAAHGITAIVLKYRLLHTPEGGPDLLRKLRARLLAVLPQYKAHDPPLSPKSNPGVADGIAAVRYVRRHALQLGVYPNRIGMLGFSAGGVVIQGTIMYGGPKSRLAFAGLIYGAFKGEARWPAGTPPIFLAVAGDDPTGAFGGTMRAFESLREQHHPAELHVFVAGGHGFGMQEQGLTSDLWLKEFVDWMAADGLLRLT